MAGTIASSGSISAGRRSRRRDRRGRRGRTRRSSVRRRRPRRRRCSTRSRRRCASCRATDSGGRLRRSRRAIDQRPGVALGAVNIPLRDVDFRDEMERAARAAGRRRERRELRPRYAEFRLGAGRGVQRPRACSRSAPASAAASSIGGRLFRAWTELGHMVIVEDGEPCQGACSGRGHVEAYCSGAQPTGSRSACSARTRRRTTSSTQRHPALERDRPAPRRRRSARSSTSSVRSGS